MTRKDYVMLSTAMRAARPAPGFEHTPRQIAMSQWRRTVATLAEHLAESNPRGFNYNQFIEDSEK